MKSSKIYPLFAKVVKVGCLTYLSWKGININNITFAALRLFSLSAWFVLSYYSFKKQIQEQHTVFFEPKISDNLPVDETSIKQKLELYNAL
jgi:hypothetical protein